MIEFQVESFDSITLIHDGSLEIFQQIRVLKFVLVSSMRTSIFGEREMAKIREKLRAGQAWS